MFDRVFEILTGINEVIPESDVNNLKRMMEDLVKWSFNPPKPTVYCRYENCIKDYAKNEIYKSDLDFEVHNHFSVHFNTLKHHCFFLFSGIYRSFLRLGMRNIFSL